MENDRFAQARRVVCKPPVVSVRLSVARAEHSWDDAPVIFKRSLERFPCPRRSVREARRPKDGSHLYRAPAWPGDDLAADDRDKLPTIAPLWCPHRIFLITLA